MKIKKEYIILAAVIVALVSYLALRKKDRAHYELPVLPVVAGKEVSKLEINKPGDTIVLNKKDNEWYLGPEAFPADEKKVKDILDTIETLTLTALVSESKNYIRYDLNEEKKISIKAWSGKSLSREFDIGKSAPTYQHTFVKLATDPNVYHARGYFRSKFDQPLDDLRDRVVLSFKEDEIHEIEIAAGENKTVIRRKEAPEKKDETQGSQTNPSETAEKKFVWHTADEQFVDEAVLNRLLSYLSDLECDGYLKDTPKENLKDAEYGVTLRGVKNYSMFIFAKRKPEDKERPAISSQNDYAFLMSDSIIDYIKNTIEDVLAPDEKK